MRDSDAAPRVSSWHAHHTTKAHLQQLARRMAVPGRSAMTKDQLVAALEKANDAETRRARELTLGSGMFSAMSAPQLLLRCRVGSRQVG